MRRGGRVPRHAVLAALAGAAILVLASCDGDGDRSGSSTATTAESPGQTIAPARQVEGRYSLDAGERRVRLTIAPTLITRKRATDSVVVPPGREQVQVDVRLDDEGRDRLDLSTVRFAAVDDAGRRVHEAFRLPPRELEPESRSSPRIVSVGFMIRRGAQLAKLEMSSILSDLPIRLAWQLPSPGG
jgi:hypothetical protein